MLYYLIIASIAGLASVAGILYSLWLFTILADTKPYSMGIHLAEFFTMLARLILFLCIANIYILFKGYIAYQNKNLPKAKLYFGISSILLYGAIIFVIYVLNN